MKTIYNFSYWAA